MRIVGVFTIFIGAMTADSDNLLIPLAIVALGTMMVLLSKKGVNE